jgi:hypothetical protein
VDALPTSSSLGRDARSNDDVVTAHEISPDKILFPSIIIGRINPVVQTRCRHDQVWPRQ